MLRAIIQPPQKALNNCANSRKLDNQIPGAAHSASLKSPTNLTESE